MTELRADSFQVEAAGLGGENPLPYFRGPENDRPLPVTLDVPPEEVRDYGRNQAERTLPHRMQDGFDRRRRPREVSSLVLENEHLRAEFVPEWGGRLWSLFYKPWKRELVHRNPVFQPANLALRQAWVSGGIEWNMGRLGHHDYTLSPVFAARVRGSGGEPVLRLYEWDRVGCFPWQIDFSLPSSSHFLYARVRLVNPHDRALSNYWWTNIAVEERPGTRILAPADAYMGIRPGDQALAFMDYPPAPEGDLSYPARSPRPSEHFLRIRPESRKWIACVDGEGRGLVQASTDRLRGRKCFAWGNNAGGRRWQEFLSVPGSAYLEIQAGLATSQLHSVTLPPRAAWGWTEAFGPMSMEAGEAGDPDYAKAWQGGERALERALPRAAVEAMEARLAPVTEAAPESLLQTGSGWAALERRRLKADGEADRIPAELVFPESSLGPDQAPWVELLDRGALPARDPSVEPGAYLVQPEWRRRLEAAAAGRGSTWAAWYHLGVMRMEHREADAAVAAWLESMRAAPSCWAARCLAVAAHQCGRNGESLAWLAQAWKLNPGPAASAVAIEWVQALNRAGRPVEALEACRSLPGGVRALDRLRIEEVRALIQTHQFEGVEAFFRSEFVVLREGEGSLSELWYVYQEKRISMEERIPIDRALQKRVRRDFPPPHAVEFV